MAAHILTVIDQLIDTDHQPKQVSHGLDYAKWGDNLDIVHFNDFTDLLSDPKCTAEHIRIMAKALRPIYFARWQEIGEPETAEAWQRNEWGGRV